MVDLRWEDKAIFMFDLAQPMRWIYIVPMVQHEGSMHMAKPKPNPGSRHIPGNASKVKLVEPLALCGGLPGGMEMRDCLPTDAGSAGR